MYKLRATSALSARVPGCQNIINHCLTLSDRGCFIAVGYPYGNSRGVKGLRRYSWMKWDDQTSLPLVITRQWMCARCRVGQWRWSAAGQLAVRQRRLQSTDSSCAQSQSKGQGQVRTRHDTAHQRREFLFYRATLCRPKSAWCVGRLRFTVFSIRETCMCWNYWTNPAGIRNGRHLECLKMTFFTQELRLICTWKFFSSRWIFWREKY